MHNQYSMSKGSQGRVKKWRGKANTARCGVCNEYLRNNQRVIQLDTRGSGHEECIFSPLAVGQQGTTPAAPGGGG